MVSEMIQIDKIDGISLSTKEVTLTKKFEELSKQLKTDVDELVQPTIFQSGGNIYLYDINKTYNIIKIIYNKWAQKMNISFDYYHQINFNSIEFNKTDNASIETRLSDISKQINNLFIDIDNFIKYKNKFFTNDNYNKCCNLLFDINIYIMKLNNEKKKIDTLTVDLNSALNISIYDKIDKNIKQINERIAKMNDIFNEIKSTYNLDKIDDNILEKFNQLCMTLKGGTHQIFKDYNIELRTLYNKITVYKIKYNDFTKAVSQYNILYMQFHNHQSFVIKYIQTILLSQDYKIYYNISKGTVYYYSQIIEDILKKIETSGLKDHNITYMRNSHYITLKIINSCFQYLLKNWNVFPNKPVDKSDEEIKNISRLIVIPNIVKLYNSELDTYDTKYIKDDDYDLELKKGLFMFNLLKDIIDGYASVYKSPVAVYLRINDKDAVKRSKHNKIFSIDDNNNFISDNIQKCTGKTQKDIQTFLSIKFKAIYDEFGFSDNSTLALFMGLPNFLAKGESIMMMTYGYSGVGKTYTIFGGNGHSGILQKTLQSIQHQEAVYFRIFEIYGLALPYKSYWTNRNPEDYYHKIYAYTKADINEEKDDTATIEKGKMDEFLSLVKNNNSIGYEELNDNEIKNFEQFVVNIDNNYRKKNGRIKKTINNPQSSRSIMVYEFKIRIKEIKGRNYATFIVMDLPGKENIIDTYINVNNDELDDYNIGLNVPMIENLITNFYDHIGDLSKKTLKEKQEFITSKLLAILKYSKLIRASMFINPIFLSIFPEIANGFITYLKNNHRELYDEIINKHVIKSIRLGINNLLPHKYRYEEDVTIRDLFRDKNITLYTTRNKNKKYIEYDEDYNEDEIDKYSDAGVTDAGTQMGKSSSSKKIPDHDKSKTPKENPKENYIKKFKICMIASEILKHIINNNKIDILCDFYKKLLNINDEISISPQTLPFEAFYINENIIGIIKSLAECPGFTKPEIGINEDFFKSLDKKSYYKIPDHIPLTITTTRKDVTRSDINDKYMFKVISFENDTKIKYNYYKKETDVKKLEITYKSILTENKELYQDKDTYIEPLPNFYTETLAQTYFIRELLRSYIRNKNTGNDVLLIEDNGDFIFDTIDYQYIYYTFGEKNTSIIKWITTTYNYDKSYTETPPIQTFMKNYFGSDSDEKPYINNFYLFYVIGNASEQDKICEKQIKMIADSKIFIDTFNSYKKS